MNDSTQSISNLIEQVREHVALLNDIAIDKGMSAMLTDEEAELVAALHRITEHKDN